MSVQSFSTTIAGYAEASLIGSAIETLEERALARNGRKGASSGKSELRRIQNTAVLRSSKSSSARVVFSSSGSLAASPPRCTWQPRQVMQLLCGLC